MYYAGANKIRKKPVAKPNPYFTDITIKPPTAFFAGQSNVSRGNSPGSGLSGAGMSQNVNGNNASPSGGINTIMAAKVNNNANVRNTSPANRNAPPQTTNNKFQVFTYANNNTTQVVDEEQLAGRPKRPVRTKFVPVKFKRVPPLNSDYKFKPRYGFPEENEGERPMPPDLLARRKDNPSDDESGRERLRLEGEVDPKTAKKHHPHQPSKNQQGEKGDKTENEYPTKSGKDTVMNVTLVSLHMPPRKSVQNMTKSQEQGFGSINSNESVHPELNTLLSQLTSFISSRPVDSTKLAITQPPRVLVEDVVRGSKPTVSAPKRSVSKREITDTEPHTINTLQSQNISNFPSQPSDIKTRRSTHHKHKDALPCDAVSIKSRDRKSTYRAPSESSLEEKKVSRKETKSTHHKHKQRACKHEGSSDTKSIKHRDRHNTHQTPSDSSVDHKKATKTKERSTHHKHREEMTSNVHRSKYSMNRKVASETSNSVRSINSTNHARKSDTTILESRINPNRRTSSVSFYEPERTKRIESRRSGKEIQHKSHGSKDRTHRPIRPKNSTQDRPKHRTYDKTKSKPSLSEDLSSHSDASFVDKRSTKNSILTTMTANTDSELNAFKSHKKYRGGAMSHKHIGGDETEATARYKKEKEALRENTKFNQNYGLTNVYNVQLEGGRGCHPDSTPKKDTHKDKAANEARNENGHKDKEKGCECKDRKSTREHRPKICSNSSANSIPDLKTLKKCHCGATGVNDNAEPNRLRGQDVLCTCKDAAKERAKSHREPKKRDLEVARSGSHTNVMYYATITNDNSFNNSEKHKSRASHVTSSRSLIREKKSYSKHKESGGKESESRKKEYIPSEKRRHRSERDVYKDLEVDSRRGAEKSQELTSQSYSHRDSVIIHRADMEEGPGPFGMRESKRSRTADSVIEMMKTRDLDRGKESTRDKVSERREEKPRDSKHERGSRHRDSESRRSRESKIGKDLVSSRGSESKKESRISAPRDKKDLKRYIDSSSKTEVLKSRHHSKRNIDADNVNDVIRAHKSQSGKEKRKDASDNLIVHEERRTELRSEKHLKKTRDSDSKSDVTKRHESRSGKDFKRNRDVDNSRDVGRRHGSKYKKGSATNKGSTDTTNIEQMMGSVILNKSYTNRNTELQTDKERKRQRRSGRDLINNEDADSRTLTRKKSTGSKKINQSILSKDSAGVTNLDRIQRPKKESDLKKTSNILQEAEKKYKNDSRTVNVSDSRIDMERRNRSKSGHDSKRNKDSVSRTDLRRSQKQSSGKVSKKNHDSVSKTDMGKTSRSGKEFKGERETSKHYVKERDSRSSKSLTKPKEPLRTISVEHLNDYESSKRHKTHRPKEADSERKENRLDSKSAKSLKKPKESFSAISGEKLNAYESYKSHKTPKEPDSERRENRFDSKSAKSLKKPKESLSAISGEKLNAYERSKRHKTHKDADSERKENRLDSKSAKSLKKHKEPLSTISVEHLIDYESSTRHKRHKESDSSITLQSRRETRRGKESRIIKEKESKSDARKRIACVLRQSSKNVQQSSKNTRDSIRRRESEAEKVRVSRSEKTVKPDKITESKTHELKGKRSTKRRDEQYAKNHRDADSVQNILDKRDLPRKGSSKGKTHVDRDADMTKRNDSKYRTSPSGTSVSQIRECKIGEDWKKNGKSTSRTTEAWNMRVSSNGLYGKSFSDYKLRGGKSARGKD